MEGGNAGTSKPGRYEWESTSPSFEQRTENNPLESTPDYMHTTAHNGGLDNILCEQTTTDTSAHDGHV